MTDSGGHSLQGAEGHMLQRHPEVGSVCCRPLRTAGRVFDAHYLEKVFNITTNL